MNFNYIKQENILVTTENTKNTKTCTKIFQKNVAATIVKLDQKCDGSGTSDVVLHKPLTNNWERKYYGD